MTTPAETVPFRAGNRLGEFVGMPNRLWMASLDELVQAGSVVRLADISEFQPSVDDAIYAAFSQAVIIRAAFGAHHDDRAWFGGERRDLLHAAGMRFLGIYQYVVAGQSIAEQVDALWRIVGPLRVGEKIVADIEEGSGSQRSRWTEWQNRALDRWGVDPWDYSGLNFAATHGLQPVNWVAAYGQPEPTVVHQLWQFTDRLRVPGIPTPCDGSLWHGNIDQLAALAFQGAAPPPPPIEFLTPAQTGAIMAQLPVITLGMSDTNLPHLYIKGRVQPILNATWHSGVAVDGVFGPKTQAAVIRLQDQYRLPQAERGKVGPATWALLVAGDH